jgi:hypothetical protein
MPKGRGKRGGPWISRHPRATHLGKQGNFIHERADVADGGWDKWNVAENSPHSWWEGTGARTEGASNQGKERALPRASGKVQKQKRSFDKIGGWDQSFGKRMLTPPKGPVKERAIAVLKDGITTSNVATLPLDKGATRTGSKPVNGVHKLEEAAWAAAAGVPRQKSFLSSNFYLRSRYVDRSCMAFAPASNMQLLRAWWHNFVQF